MSFLAGYVSQTGKYEADHVQTKVSSYSIVSGENSQDYKNLIVEMKFGHIIQKYKTTHPIQPRCIEDVNGNLLLTLGFFRSPDSVDYEDLFERCVNDSVRYLETCEGEFVALFAEGNSGRVHIINDRFASRPFYILQSENCVYFSSNLGFLLYLAGGKHGIDVVGWFQIIGCGHTCGTRTTLKDVRRMKPATHLAIMPDEILDKSYWHLEHKPEYDLEPKTYSRQVFEAFQSGATWRAKLIGKGVVALSGGLDSRLVAAALPKDTDYSFFTFVNSMEQSNTIETEVAAEICQILEHDHQIKKPSDQEFSRVASSVIKLTGGLRPFQHMAIVMPYIHEIRGRGLSFLLGGGPGDIIAGSKIPSVVYLDPNRLDECIDNFCLARTVHSRQLKLLFRDDIVEQFSQQSYTSLLDSFEDISGPTAAHRVTAWGMLHRWPAFTFTSVLHNHPDVGEAFCHLDYRYIDLMLKLPADWLYKRNFYPFMIYWNLPQLRHVRYANTGKPLSGKLIRFSYKQPSSKRLTSTMTNLARKYVHRSEMSQRLIQLVKSSTRTRSPGPMSFYYSLFRNDEDLLSEIADCLHSYPSLQEVLDTEKCQRFLTNFRTGNLEAQSYKQQTEMLGTLATMCLSFKYLSL